RSDGAESRTTSARRASRLAAPSWIVLTRSTVQVATDASVKLMMTAFTTRSACTNMPQGDNASGNVPPALVASETARGSTGDDATAAACDAEFPADSVGVAAGTAGTETAAVG